MGLLYKGNLIMTIYASGAQDNLALVTPSSAEVQELLR